MRRSLCCFRCILTFSAAGLIVVAAMSQEPDDAKASHAVVAPVHVAPWAIPSDTGHYVGHAVGGGAAHRHRADAPRLDDGTWGWDYEGGLFRRRVNLGWWHGRRAQGGTGAYQTDGPDVLHPLGR